MKSCDWGTEKIMFYLCVCFCIIHQFSVDLKCYSTSCCYKKAQVIINPIFFPRGLCMSSWGLSTSWDQESYAFVSIDWKGNWTYKLVDESVLDSTCSWVVNCTVLLQEVQTLRKDAECVMLLLPVYRFNDIIINVIIPPYETVQTCLSVAKPFWCMSVTTSISPV